MPSLIDFPLEVLTIIVDACDREAFLQLCLTNKGFLAIAQKFLYRQVHLTTLRKSIICCRTVLAKPSLALAIRECYVTFHTCDFVFNSFWRLLSKVLVLAYNLTELDLGLGTDEYSDIVLRSCTFPRLERFTMICIDTGLGDFLNRHPKIKKVFLGGSPGDHLDLPRSSLPALESYLGSRFLAMDIIPGRPVFDAEVSFEEDTSERDVKETILALSQGSIPMRFFGSRVSTTPTNTYIIEALAEYMPQLYGVRMNNTAIGGMEDLMFMKTIFEVLDRFKELRYLHIPTVPKTRRARGDYTAYHEANEMQLILYLKARCPKLEHITLPTCMEWIISRDGHIRRCGYEF